MFTNKQKKDFLKGFKLATKKSKIQNDIDLYYVNLIKNNSFKNKIAVIVNSDSLTEDFNNGSMMLQKRHSNEELYLIDNNYTSFRNFVKSYEQNADLPFSIEIDNPINYK
jgi:hypothetical protein